MLCARVQAAGCGVLVVLGLGACGDDASRGDASAPTNAPDASTHAPDASTQEPRPIGGTGTPGPRCNPAAPFGAPRALGRTVNTVSSEHHARMSPDMRTLYFARGSGIDADLYTATRASEAGEFGDPVALPGDINLPKVSDFPPNVDRDALRLVFGSSRGLNQQIYFTTRPSHGAAWQPAALVFAAPKGVAPSPYLAADGSALYFFHDLGNESGVAVSRRAPDGSYGAPTFVAGVPKTSASERYAEPVLTNDERIIYLQNGGAIHRGTRADAAAPFGPLEPFYEIDSRSRDIVSWVSDDDCVLLVTRAEDRDARADIYISERPR